MSDLNRRQFVVNALSIAAAACACCCGADEALAGPGVNPAAAGPVDIGPASDYPKDGISNKFVRSHKLLVIRNEGRIYASTAVCPHKGRVLTPKPDKTLLCPGHGSTFSIQGTVTKGPAKDSLVRYAISKNDAGHLVVDMTKSFSEAQWSDSASFFDLKAG